MKSLLHPILFILFALLLFSQVSLAQAPEGINYQAVVRNGLGIPLVNQAVTVQFTIHQTTPTGAVVYQETHATTSNQFGLITSEIGAGTVVSGVFTAINWGLGTYYLQVEVDPGTGFEDLGATQFVSVPYALYAKTSGNGPQGLNSLIDTTGAGASCPNGGYQVLMGLDANSNLILEAGEVTSSFFVCNGSAGLAINWLGSFSTPPAGTANDAYYNSGDGVSYIFNGSTMLWDTLAAGGAAAADNDWVINGANMYSHPSIIGNVGIGTITPSKKLHIESSFNGGDGVLINNNNATGNPGLEFQTQGISQFVLGVDQTDNNKFKIGTSGVNINTRFTINNSGQVGIGTINPVQQLTVLSNDTLVASFSGSNSSAAAIGVIGTNPLAKVGAIFLTGGDTGVIAMDPVSKQFFMSNSTVGGHAIIYADSSTSLYGMVVGNIAQNLIYNKSESTYNETDTLFNYSTTGTIVHVNQGSFFTDSLYVLGNNMSNPNWVLANDGLGQAVWTDPNTLVSGGGLWQSNVPDIYFNTGNVGIGTTTPVQLFTLSTPGSTTLRLERSNATAYDWEMNVDNTGFHLKGGADATAGGLTDFVNVDGNGLMGLGITTPTQLLHLYNGTLRIDDGANPYNLPSSDGTTAGQVMVTDGAGNLTWQTPVSTTNSRIQDLDNNTWVETDILATGLEDKIRFSLNGTERVIIDNNGMVGIGTAFPGAPLHIANGAFGSSASIALMSNNANPTNVSNLSFFKSRGSEAAPTAINQNDEIGAIEFNAYNSVSYANAGLIQVIADENFGSTSMGSHMEFHIAPLSAGSPVEVMRIANDGHVGLGTSLPAEKLHIMNGTIKIDDGLYPYTLPLSDGTISGQVLTTDALGNVTWQTPSSGGAWSTSGTQTTLNNINDFVGIGTNNPTISLQIESNTSPGIIIKELTPTSGAVIILESLRQHLVHSNENGDFKITDLTSSEERMVITPTGFIGMGTTSPLTQLHVADEAQTTIAIQASHNGLADQSSNLTFARSRGTVATPTMVLSGDRLGKLEWVGWNGGTGSFEEKASIRVLADENYNGGSTASHMEFHVTPFGQSTSIEAVNIANNGFVGIGTTSPATKLDVIGKIKITDGTEGNGKELVSNTSGVSTWKERVIGFYSGNDSGAGATLIPSSSWTTIYFSAASPGYFNDGGGYSSATGVFTAPVQGVYQLNAILNLLGGITGDNIIVNLRYAGGFVGQYKGVIDLNGNLTIPISATVGTNGFGNIYWIEVWSTNGCQWDQYYSSFSGNLVYAY